MNGERSDGAALSAVVTTLEDLTTRVVEVANRYKGTPGEHVASALYEVERDLKSASRRLARLVREHLRGRP